MKSWRSVKATSSAPSLLQESEAGHTPGIANALSFRNETSCLRSSRVHAGITTHFPVNSDTEESEGKQVEHEHGHGCEDSARLSAFENRKILAEILSFGSLEILPAATPFFASATRTRML